MDEMEFRKLCRMETGGFETEQFEKALADPGDLVPVTFNVSWKVAPPD